MKDSTSLLQDLLQVLPNTKAQIYFKASLTAISHAMEDLVLAGSERRLVSEQRLASEQPLVIANFQQERFYRQETRRYHKIAQRTDQVYVLAAPETDFASAPAPFATIGLDPDDGLAQEWHLVIVGENYSACLICREYAAPIDTISLDSARQFRGFWTFDPAVSRQAARALLDRIEQYRPDLLDSITEAKHRYQLQTAPVLNQQIEPSNSGLDVYLFTDRLVNYLQSSQYKQVNSYRRIVTQERQERLVNRITAVIRRSLNPEEVLTSTAQEVAPLFGSCRCFVYRYPMPLFDPQDSQTLQKVEYLATHPTFQVILEQGDMVAIADINQDSGIQADRDFQRDLVQAQIQACLLIPITYQRKCLAVLELHQAQPHLWSVADRELLTQIADRVGLALTQAEAYVHLEQLNQKLVAIEQTQNNLIAIVGHELRTPLSTIQVCLESLANEPDIPLEFQQPLVEIALADLERLRKLIQDFLLLSRLESQLITWQLEPINLADSIALVMNQIRTASRSQELPTITVDLPPILPMVIADGEALSQLLSKLLDNACKFTPPTGEITVKVRDNLPAQTLARSQTLVQSAPQPMLEVQIADTGRGIEPNQLEQIFERFHQEEGFLQRAVGGAGLGLAICRQLAEQLGGHIWAASEGRGQGSQFYVTIPVLVN